MIEHLKALAVFAKTVECGSFREAARRLSLSPSVISHHVTQLERRLSVALLYRSTRRLALTPAGEAVYASAREMLAAAERGFEAGAGSGSGGLRGLLRVTAPALLAETRFCRDIASFARTHPEVTLHVAFTERRHDLLRDGLDLALRIGDLEDSTHKVRRLTVMRRVLVAAPQYVAERAAPRTLRDLQGWDFIQLSARRPELALVPPGKKAPATLDYRPRVAVDSATAMREMAVSGLGVASMPEVVARKELARGRLVEVLPGWTPPLLGVFAVWPAGAGRAPLTAAFVEFIEGKLAAIFGEGPAA